MKLPKLKNIVSKLLYYCIQTQRKNFIWQVIVSPIVSSGSRFPGQRIWCRTCFSNYSDLSSIRQSTAGFFRYPTNASTSLSGFSPTCPSEREEPGKKVADEASCLEKNDTFFVRQTNWMLSCIRGSLKGNAFREILVRVTSWCLGWVNIESSWAGLPPPLPKNRPPSLWFTAKKGYSASCHFYQLRSLQITTKLLLDCFCCL